MSRAHYLDLKPGDKVRICVPGEWERGGEVVDTDVWGRDEPLVRVRWGKDMPGGERETFFPAVYVFPKRQGGAA